MVGSILSFYQSKNHTLITIVQTSSTPPPAGISFIPHEVGEHLVSILKNGAHIPSSPIPIMVVQSEIGDASLVKAHGDGLVQATTFSDASFIVDTREAGQCQRFTRPSLL